jgi:hypothetical protein
MSANPKIALELVVANTMVTLPADLSRATSRNFKPIFNGAGSFSLQVPLASDAARIARERAHGLVFYRNDRPVWSGGLTSIVKSAAANTCSITATGWHEELEHRQIWKVNEAGLVFGTPGVTGGTIINAIIAAINSQTDSNGTTRPVRLSFGTATDTQLRTGSYKAGDVAWTKIKELIEIENGCDIVTDWLTKQISTRPPDQYRVRKGVQFGFGTDPNNLDDVEETVDGTVVGNRQSVVAANGAVYAADDTDAIGEMGVMLEDWTSLSDVKDPTIAAAYANAQLVFKARGLKTYKLTPKKYGDIPGPTTTSTGATPATSPPTAAGSRSALSRSGSSPRT